MALFLTLTFSPTVMAVSDTTCGDLLRWCEDPHNFMEKRCPHDITAPNFDPAMCQNLYNTIAQEDCVVRAFRGAPPLGIPCVDVQLPYGDYSDGSLDMSAAAVACENLSVSNVLCVDEFSKLNPNQHDIARAFKCIFAAARRTEFEADKRAKECLKFTAAVSVGDDREDSVGQKSLDTEDGSGMTLEPEEPVARRRQAAALGDNRGPVAIKGGISGNACIDSPHHEEDGVARVWSCQEGNWNQMWSYTSSGQLKLYTTEWCLDGKPEDGGKVHLWECGYNNWNQMWSYDSSSKSIKLKGTNYCLTDWGSRRVLGWDYVRMLTCGSGSPVDRDGQRWSLPTVPKTRRRVARTASSILAGEPIARPTLSGMIYKDDENKIPKAEVSCDDVLRWCEDQQNFLTKNCDSTAKDFDPATCQNLYNVIGQSDCVVRAFRSPPSKQDPCSNAKLPWGDYDDQALDEMESMVACENFSYSHVLCVDLFSKLNPSDTDIESAFNCIFAAAKHPDMIRITDAQNCLKFEDASVFSRMVTMMKA